jgi:hypothetical protein
MACFCGIEYGNPILSGSRPSFTQARCGYDQFQINPVAPE